MMKKLDLVFKGEAWADYQYWQTQDRKTLKRVNKLITDTLRNPFTGLGEPEPLQHELSGYWSRRIDETNRMVYCVLTDYIEIIQLRFHY